MKKTFSKLLKSLRPWLIPIIFIIILAIISVVLTIFGPKILGSMTTDAVTSLTTTGAIDWDPIARSALLLVALYVASAIISYIQGYILAIVTAHYTKKLRAEIINKISRLPISYFDQHQFGDTLSRMTNDVDTISSSLSQSLTEIISSITTVIGILIMMLTISIPLSLVALIAVPISFFFVQKIAKKAQTFFRNQRTTLGHLNNSVEESYSGHLIIKSNSYEPTATSKFQNINQSLYEASWKSQFFSSLAFPVTHIFTNLSYVAVCVVGGYLAVDGKISIGNIQAFIQYVNQFNRPITEVAQISSTIQLTLAAAERVFTFLDEPEESKDPSPALQLSKVRGAVEFHDVNFSYDKSKPIIKHFSTSVKPGSQVAIVGPTGAGKTTIVNLLMRFYDPDSGFITIDDVPTREMTRNDVRALFGMVLQDTWLFSGTIEENLRYGNPKATQKDIEKATKLSGIHHFIESLPKGYQTIIDEDSDNISAGEKQLLTIARAMIANPSMMILDEATSNVDTRTEQLIQTAFEHLTAGRTSFVIAHRLSTIRNSDLILVMREGNIVEQGTHDQLLAQNGFYAELYNSQFTED